MDARVGRTSNERELLMKTDILIVGGGLAGLALADRLEQVGVDYLLVEARERFGGRIVTHDIEGAGFDLGPAWFWPGQPLMRDLVDRLKLGVFEQFSAGDTMSEDRRGVVRRGMGFMSMQGSWRVEGGLGGVVAGLAGLLPRDKLRLGTRVISLSLDGDTVAAEAATEAGIVSIEARRVVMALPPRVAETTIDFTPALPDHVRRALTNIPTWMAGQAKIVAVYDRPYWRDAGLSGDAMSQTGPMGEIHDASPAEGGPYALFGFVGFPPDLRHSRREEVMQLARQQLVALFGEQMHRPLALILQDWAQDPLTATAADHASNGHHPAYGMPYVLKELWDNRLHFGSTEVASQFGGFLEGALQASQDVGEYLAVLAAR